MERGEGVSRVTFICVARVCVSDLYEGLHINIIAIHGDLGLSSTFNHCLIQVGLVCHQKNMISFFAKLLM